VHDLPYLVDVTEVNEKGGQDQPGTINKEEKDEVNWKEQGHGNGQIP